MFHEHVQKMEKILWIEEVIYMQNLWIFQRSLTH